jgi:hypothetical protein
MFDKNEKSYIGIENWKGKIEKFVQKLKKSKEIPVVGIL